MKTCLAREAFLLHLAFIVLCWNYIDFCKYCLEMPFGTKGQLLNSQNIIVNQWADWKSFSREVWMFSDRSIQEVNHCLWLVGQKPGWSLSWWTVRNTGVPSACPRYFPSAVSPEVSQQQNATQHTRKSKDLSDGTKELSQVDQALMLFCKPNKEPS